MGLLLEYDPNPKQLEALEKWNDDVTEEIAFGGAKGGGKSNLGATCIFHDALVYPETRYFIARQTLKDLRLYTVPTIHETFSLWNISFDKYCKFNGQDNNFTTYNGSLVQLLECAYMPSDPFYERFGSMQWTRGWIEEGGEVSDLAHINLKLGIGRWKNDLYKLLRKLLITCNPKKNWIKYNFVEPQIAGRLDKKRAFIASSVYDNKHRQRGYEKVLEELTGVSRQRLLLMNWDYDSDDDCLINSEKIFDLYNNSHVEEGEFYVTADVGRFGKDKTVIWIWKGFKVIRVIILHKKNTSEVAEEIRRVCSIYQIPMSNVAVDDDGVGGGVVDQLTGCYGFVNNSSPLPPIIETYPTKKENFDNLKSQCYYALATKINQGGVWIACDLSSEYVEEKTVKQLLNEDLEQVRQKEVDSDKKKGVLPKDKVKEILGRSPDYSDGMMMRMVFELVLQYSWVAL